jgi:hypothetical protein
MKNLKKTLSVLLKDGEVEQEQIPITEKQPTQLNLFDDIENEKEAHRKTDEDRSQG